jgi:hypothetical protein
MAKKAKKKSAVSRAVQTVKKAATAKVNPKSRKTRWCPEGRPRKDPPGANPNKWCKRPGLIQGFFLRWRCHGRQEQAHLDGTIQHRNTGILNILW